MPTPDHEPPSLSISVNEIPPSLDGHVPPFAGPKPGAPSAVGGGTGGAGSAAFAPGAGRPGSEVGGAGADWLGGGRLKKDCCMPWVGLGLPKWMGMPSGGWIPGGRWPDMPDGGAGRMDIPSGARLTCGGRNRSQ